MSRCIVHVGMYKTGTTSIQRSFHHYEDDRFAYADPGGHPNHSQAIFALLGVEHPLARAHGAEARDSTLRRFRRSMAAAGGRTFLISGEGLVNLPTEKLRELKSLLGEYFEEIEVAAAIRPPAGYMASALQTRIKRMRDPHLGRFFRYRGYEASFRKFDEVFGREHVVLWKYEPATYPGGCAVRDFCARFGITLPEQRIVRINESLSREALGLLYIYRRAGAQFGATTMRGPENDQLARAMMGIGSTRFRFAPDTARAFLKAHRSDIEWMAARLGQGLDEDFDEPRPDDVRSEADLLEVQPHAVSSLLAALGPAAPKGNPGRSPQQVAELVHALRVKTAATPSNSVRRGLAEKLLARLGMGNT